MKSLDFVKSRINNLEALLLVVSDPRARRILVAWSYYRPPTLRDSEANVKLDPYEMLSKLWSQYTVDMDRLSALADVPITKTEKIFWRMKESALVWPDGTISDSAKIIIAAEANTYRRGLLPKQGR